MDMSYLKNAVRALSNVELKNANKVHEPFHNPHEGYAVLKEEIEEADEARHLAEEPWNKLWLFIKKDMPAEVLRLQIDEMENNLVSQAAETIQAIAMCRKFKDMLEVKKYD